VPFVKSVSLVILAVVAVTAVSACGSSHRRIVVYGGSATITEPTRGYAGFHSPNHHYSVGEVEAVFAGHGIQLHEVHRPKTYAKFMPVLLRYGRGMNLVAVAIVRPEPDNAEFFGARTGTPRPRITHHGDLIAFYYSGHSAAVKSALAELH
jgi:hypothetical protein